MSVSLLQIFFLSSSFFVFPFFFLKCFEFVESHNKRVEDRQTMQKVEDTRKLAYDVKENAFIYFLILSTVELRTPNACSNHKQCGFII